MRIHRVLIPTSVAWIMLIGALAQPAITPNPLAPPYTNFAVTSSDAIIFVIERDPALDNSTIPVTIPCSASPCPPPVYTVMKKGPGQAAFSPCAAADPNGCGGSDVDAPPPGTGGALSVQITNVSEPAGKALFKIKMEVSGVGNWLVNSTTNAAIQSIQAMPRALIVYPAEIPFGQANVSLKGSTSTSTFVPAAGAPAIASYSWTAGSGAPAVSSANTADTTFDAPSIAAGGAAQNLQYQLTVSDGELASSTTATVTVRGPELPVDAVISMDTSGSMGWHRTGAAKDLQGGCCSRLASAKFAARYMVSRLEKFSSNSRVGVAIFPGEPSPSTVLGKRWTPATGLAGSASFASVRTDIGAETVTCGDCTTIPASGSAGTPTGIPVNWNGTPTRNGLDVAKTMLTTASGSASRSKIIVLLSDGAWNMSGDPADPTYLAGFNSAGIKIYTIGMGTGADNVNHASLQDISIRTGVGSAANPIGFTSYNLGDTSETNLIPQFEKILGDMVSLDFVSDPQGVIAPGGTNTHNFAVTSHDSQISVTLSWESSQTNLLQLEVIPPGGSPIGPNDSGNGYHNVTLGRRILAASPGQWTIRVGRRGQRPGVSGSPSGPLAYNYSVLIKSNLIMRVSTNRDRYSTGGEMILEARLVEANRRLPGAKVTARLTRPESGIGNWHLQHKVEASQLADVPKTISGEPLTAVDKKNFVLLQQQHVALPGETTEPAVTLNDLGQRPDQFAGDGIYTGRLTGFPVPGVYDITIVADGTAATGEVYHREAFLQEHVELFFDAGLIASHTKIVGLEISPLFPAELRELLSVDPPAGFVRRMVVFTPQDARGNYWGPGQSRNIKFNVSNAQAIGNPVDNLDGSYTQVIQFRSGTTPTVTVNVGAGGVNVMGGPIREAVESSRFRYLWWLLILLLIIVVAIFVIRKLVTG